MKIGREVNNQSIYFDRTVGHKIMSCLPLLKSPRLVTLLILG